MVVHYQLGVVRKLNKKEKRRTQKRQKEEEKDYFIVDLVKKFPIKYYWFCTVDTEYAITSIKTHFLIRI